VVGAARICAREGWVLPYAPSRSAPAQQEAGQATPASIVQGSGNHSCAAFPCTRWPRAEPASPLVASSPGSAQWSAAAPTLADFGPSGVDRVTLPQAFYMARRAEALAHWWTQWGSAGERAAPGAQAADPQVRQALYAGTGPMSTLLRMCGCGRQ
jgi:hypothetical protein